MTVGAILKEKGGTVHTAQSRQTLMDVVLILTDRSIGAVLVTDSDGQPVGILSERDIVRALAVHGGSVLDQPVADFMTEKVISCAETDTVESIMALMTEKRFRHVPVITNGRLVGLVSIGDVVRARMARVEAEAEALKDYISG